MWTLPLAFPSSNIALIFLSKIFDELSLNFILLYF